MLLFSILLLPVVLGADREWNFGQYIVRTNEKNTLIGVELGPYKPGYAFELNLSNLGLEHIDPNVFDNVTEILVLNLANNWLTTLPKHVFSKLNSLRHLSLADNNISSLHRVFIGLGSLETLDLSNNPLEHIGESDLHGIGSACNILTKGIVFPNISSLLFEEPQDSLKSTILENNIEITKNSTDLATINFAEVDVCTRHYWREKLSDMLIDGSELTSVNCSQVTANQTDLRLTLYYFFVSKRNLGSEILNELPENVVELDLSNNEMSTLKPEIENRYLRVLIMDFGRIWVIRDNAFANTNLSVLSLNFNSLQNTKFAKTLPSSLEELYLSGNDISVIPPDSFSGLKNLVKLDLSNNNVKNIEAGTFRNLGALRELNLYKNTVIIYKGIFAGLNSIEYLNIGMNRLNETKNILFAMPDTLETVILDCNEIESLEVGSFVRVPKRKLSLKRNNIHSVVEGSFNLPSLKELDLGINQLTQLGENSFKGLEGLKLLSLGENKITKLKDGDLMYLPNLESLNVSSNPIKKLLRSALRGMPSNSIVLLSDVPVELIQKPLFS